MIKVKVGFYDKHNTVCATNLCYEEENNYENFKEIAEKIGLSEGFFVPSEFKWVSPLRIIEIKWSNHPLTLKEGVKNEN